MAADAVGDKRLLRNRGCAVAGCSEKHKAKGYCNTHYRRLQDKGHVGDERKAPSTETSCAYCGKHLVSRKGRRFCDGTCSRRYANGRKLEAICAVCGKTFPLRLRSTSQCCSRECHRAKRNAVDAARMATDHEYRQKRLAQKLAANSRYSRAHREKVAAYYAKRRKVDPDYKMKCWARSVLHKVLVRANKRKDARCVELLGYDGAELRRHIERQFTAGMSWDRFGSEIEIDHIVPIAEHLRRGVTDPAVINALSNLRPMWARDNRQKGDTVISLL